MSERHPHKSGLSPAPLPLALGIAAATIVVVVGLYLFIAGMNAPVPIQTGAAAKANELGNNPGLPVIAIQEATATEALPSEEETELPTLDLPTPTQPPEPTAYIPGPTAQFDRVVPVEDWLLYVDEQAGFSIQYPPDWYLTTTPLEDRHSDATTQLYSYDPNDPNPVPKGTRRPENFVKLDITNRTIPSRRAFLPGETLAEWVQRTQPRSGDEMTILEEGETTLGESAAYLQKTSYKGSEGIAYYVQRGTNMFYIGYLLPPPDSIHEQTIESILASLRFLE